MDVPLRPRPLLESRQRRYGERMSKRHVSIAEQLRKAIRAAERAGITRYRVAQDTGISEAQLSRIVHGQIEPKLSTAERILSGIGKRLAIVDR